LAIEDTMEILAKALDYERITLDGFLKVPIFPTQLFTIHVDICVLGNAKISERTVLNQGTYSEDLEIDRT